MTRAGALRSVGPVGAALAVIVALVAGPAEGRVASSQTLVSDGDTVQIYLSIADGCIESSIFLLVSESVSRPGGQPLEGGTIFYVRYNECTDEYLAGINEPFQLESGALSVNGDLGYGTARFTTSAREEVSQAVVAISVDLSFTASGDMFHDHDQEIFYIDGVGYAAQGSEWYRPAQVTGTICVGGVGGTAAGDGAMVRGRSTTVIQTFSPPFPHSP